MGTFNSAPFGHETPGFQPAPPALLASDLAYVAYRIAGIVAEAGRGYSASEGADALRVLNSLIDSWQAERLMVWAYLRSVFTIVPRQASYKVGNVIVNGVVPDWTGIPRPEEIKLAGYLFTNTTPNVENPMKILTYQQWAALSPKDLTSPIEYMLYYQPDVPNGTVFLWPVPTDPSIKVALYTWTNVQKIASLSTAMLLPPAYQELFEYAAAIRLAGMFPRRSKLDPNAPAMYDAALIKVRSANVPELMLQCELGSGGVKQSVGRWNILSNTTIGGWGGGTGW